MSNGGTAFPCSMAQVLGMEYQPGMSLRDYFAAKAMQAIITKHEVLKSVPAEKLASEAQLQAEGAYIYADALLKARSA